MARYLSLLERERIQDLHRSGLSIRGIAAEMGRSPSTISRELRRNTVSVRGYLPHTAHRLSVTRRARSRQPKLLANVELREFVQSRLGKKWSPQQISNRLAKDFPDAPLMRVSTETIYQAIYVHARGELKREFTKQLRRRHAARKPHKQPDARRPRFVDAMQPIAERPEEIETRQVPGHWEGDLIIGAASGSAIATLVERTSRFVMLVHLGRDRSADAVRDSLINTVHQMPDALRGTLTWDQGAEMSEHRGFTIATGHAGLLLRARLTLAARHQRKYQRPAAPVLPERHRPVDPHGRPASSRRQRTQRATPQVARLGQSSRAHLCFTDRLIEPPLRRLLESKRCAGR